MIGPERVDHDENDVGTRRGMEAIAAERRAACDDGKAEQRSATARPSSGPAQRRTSHSRLLRSDPGTVNAAPVDGRRLLRSLSHPDA